jgi:hypothetical protein
MARIKYPEGLKKTEELRIEAFNSGQASDWGEAYDLWKRIYKIEKSMDSQILLLECARLSGNLPAISFRYFREVNTSQIIRVLGAGNSVELIRAIQQRQFLITPNDRREIQSIFGLLPTTLAKMDSKIVLSSRKELEYSEELTEVPMMGLRLLGESSSIIRDSYLTQIPKFQVLHSEKKVITTHKEVENVLDLRLVTVRNALVTMGSDAYKIRAEWFFDRINIDGAEILRIDDDPIIMAFNASKVVFKNPSESVAVLESALWLGYPATQEWGHFFLECILRLSIFESATKSEAITVLLNDSIPNTFRDFIHIVFPWVRARYFSVGQSIEVNECHFIPARVLLPYRFNHTKKPHPMNQEPQSYSIFKEIIDKRISSGLFNSLRDSRNIFLERTQSKYRNSEQSDLIKTIFMARNFLCIDPGTLSPTEEIELFLGAGSVVGLTGSQLLLSMIAPTDTKLLVITHDFPGDHGFNLSWQRLHETKIEYLFGHRSNSISDYSEEAWHQSPILENDSLLVLEQYADQHSSA